MRFQIILLITLCIATVVLARSKSKSKSNKAPEDTEITQCKNMNLTMSCPHGYYISITEAMYGRLTGSICPYGAISNTNCSFPGATDVARKACNNKRKCVLNVGTAQFNADPCVGTDKYLDVKYKCILCHECCPNEEFRVDHSNCEPNCLNLTKPDVCVTAPGCACKPGYVRDDYLSGKCVVPYRCPFFFPDYPLCRTNEEYVECGTNCTSTCQTDRSQLSCTQQCIPGFYCCKGFIRDETDGRCIKEDDCPCVS